MTSLLLAQHEEENTTSCFPRVGKVCLQSEYPPSRPLTPMAFLQPFHCLSCLCPNPRLAESFIPNSSVPVLQALTPTPPHRRWRLPASSWPGSQHWVLLACVCWEDEAGIKCSLDGVGWGWGSRSLALAEVWALCWALCLSGGA